MTSGGCSVSLELCRSKGIVKMRDVESRRAISVNQCKSKRVDSPACSRWKLASMESDEYKSM